MLKFDRQGLVPAVIIDDSTGEVLMVAFMNEEAYQKTRETGYTHFFSRSRNTIWRKGEQSGNVQQVCDMFINCEENSLLISVVQHGGASCHEGYRSCYYRRILPDGSYETIMERVFDPQQVYHQQVSPSSEGGEFPIAIEYTENDKLENTTENQEKVSSFVQQTQIEQQLESLMRQLYDAYLYLRDNDLSEQSNTSRLLQDHSPTYLVSRLSDELQELIGVLHGEHVHSGQTPDTVLEGSQVGYWLFLLASTYYLRYDDFLPHEAMLEGYNGRWSEAKALEQWQECINLLSTHQQATIAQGMRFGFSFIGWACAESKVSLLAPVEYDVEQMRRKGLIS